MRYTSTKSAFSYLMAAIIITSACTQRARSYETTDELFASGAITVPREFIRGTASEQEVYAWSASLLNWNKTGQYPELDSLRLDVDGDGVGELFISQPSHAGGGGNSYLTFQQSGRGYRYLGKLAFGGIRVAARDSVGRARVVTTWRSGGGAVENVLWVLSGEGFREVARCTLQGAGDSGSVEGKRLGEMLFEGELTEEVLRILFSARGEVTCVGL